MDIFFSRITEIFYIYHLGSLYSFPAYKDKIFMNRERTWKECEYCDYNGRSKTWKKATNNQKISFKLVKKWKEFEETL